MRRTDSNGAKSESPRTTVLVVDDEEGFHETVAQYLGGYRRLTAYNGWQALEKLAKHHVDVVLLDINLPDTNGLKLLDQIRAERDDVEVIMITSQAEIRLAVQAVKAGAFDFLAKTYENYQRVGDHIERALEHRRRRRHDILSAGDEALRDGIAQLEGSKSAEVQQVVAVLRQVAATPLTVLVEGESGVGKELLAHYVHRRSDRAARPFVPVNLAAIPPALTESTLFGHEKGAFTSADRQRLGKFELADGGTLFLDEIGDLDPTAQAKLLRALQERTIDRVGGAEPAPVDVRVIAATNKNLETEVMAGRFRQDLWFRLNVVRVAVPPLRQRKGDIPGLVRVLAERASRVLKRPALAFDKEAIKVLQAHSWPGNVRELENLIMRLAALHQSDRVHAGDIPIEYCVEHLGNLAVWFAKVHKDKDAEKSNLYNLATEHFERYFVRYMVDRCAGNMAEAARRLGVSYATVKNKMASDDEEGAS